MKERQSVKFANYTKTREEWYRKDCGEIIFRTKFKIIIENTIVFEITNNQKAFLFIIDNPKTSWFQIWLKLHDER